MALSYPNWSFLKYNFNSIKNIEKNIGQYPYLLIGSIFVSSSISAKKFAICSAISHYLKSSF